MKTKNFLLTGALLIVALFSVNGVMAAEPIATQSNAKVSIIIDDILSIQVLTPEVELRYDNPNDFTEGVSKEMGKHLLINATRSFHLKVFTTSPFTKEGGTTIAGSTIEISAKASNGSYGKAVKLNANAVNGGAQSLFDSPQEAGFGLKYDVNYFHQFNDANTAINTATGVYKADVTYQITAS